MKKLTADRFRLVTMVSFVTALALGSSWLALVTKKQLTEESTPERTEPDYVIDNFSYVRMTPLGQPQYNMTGARMTHFPANDSFLIHQPFMTRYGKLGEIQTMRSETAVVEDENRKVHMYTNVVTDRPAFGTIESLHMTTDYLLLYPDEDIMQTPNDVIITRGTTRLSGTGMFANNYTREFKLYNQTRVSIAAPEIRKAGKPKD